MDSLMDTWTVTQLLLSSIVAYLVYSLAQALYNITLHPLANFPGPKLRGAFYIPNSLEVITGDFPYNFHQLHERYGEVVRVNPTTLSFIKPDAWRDIYGHGTTMPLKKDPSFYYRPPGDIISANDADHARIRRPLNHAFSEQALRSQESVVNSYITLLITKLHKRATSNEPVDMTQWLNFTTFDITGDLAFDESFSALENEVYNPWMYNLFAALRSASILGVIKNYPIIGVPVMALLKSVPALANAEFQHNNFTEEKIERRLRSKTERKDFLSYIIANNRGTVTDTELKQSSGTLILGGSETSATLLSGALYYLLKNPQWMTKLHQELQDNFQSDSDITFTALSQLKTFNAIIQETFRIYPPVPTALPRIVPEDGATVCGHVLPPGTRVGVPQYSMYRSSQHFTNPDVYAPERFLGAKEYRDDKRHVIQPFSVGPRNCIGQSLAWAEIRSILARLVWNFEIVMLDEGLDWEGQKVFILWQKPGLVVKLKAREGVV